MVCSRVLRVTWEMNWAEARSAIPSPYCLTETKNHLTIYLSAQQQCCTAAITWHLNFDDQGKQLFGISWTRQVTNFLLWWEKEPSQITSSTRQGSAWSLVSTHRFLLLNWNSESCLTRTLAALTISLLLGPLSFSCPCSAWWRPHFQPQAKRGVLPLPICHMGVWGSLIAEWFQALPRRPEWAAGKPSLSSQALPCSPEELPWRLRCTLLHQDPDSPSIAPSMWGPVFMPRDRRYLPNKVSPGTSQHPASSLQLKLHTTAMQSVPQYTQLTSLLRNLWPPVERDWLRLSTPSL